MNCSGPPLRANDKRVRGVATSRCAVFRVPSGGKMRSSRRPSLPAPTRAPGFFCFTMDKFSLVSQAPSADKFDHYTRPSYKLTARLPLKQLSEPY
eukprot:1147178-Pyramimonas_sp.AAC.1